jgi:hypothetical protein
MESNEVTKQWRYRVNVSRTSKGVPSFDCTVEGIGCDFDDVLAASDILVAELDSRYKSEWNV